ncbi:MAG TPA: sodium:solute symporter family protein [Terriglobales bacterium]|nr:sodium:solute symporter family protein [Terriglobales bacterium]
MKTIDYVTVVVFLLGVSWLGSRFYRWIGAPDDFYLAGRQLTPFILAATMTTANISLFSLIGVSGTAYQSGISIIWLTWTGNMALVFSGLFVIPVLRRLRIRTVPEFLEMRYSPGVRSLVSVLWIVRLTFWISVVLYAGVMAAEQLTGLHSFLFWVLVFAAIVVMYTSAGGMWSIVLTNNLGFFLVMVSVLTVLPIAMRSVGWWPGLQAHLPAQHLTFVLASGKYNWKFILAILLLGLQWASLDQGLLQSAFAAQDPKVVSKGMVLSALMITPFAFLWITPGLAARVLYPGLPKSELAIPTLILHLLPAGALGLVICGFMASGLSTIGSNLGAVATLITNDIYGRFFRTQASPKQLVFAARIATLIAGLLMVAITYLIPYLGGAVDAYLTVISIMDMPLFVIAIVYGLLWRRATWQGAMAGYLSGALAGAVLRFGFHYDIAIVTVLSGGVALLVCPLVSLSTPSSSRESRLSFMQRHSEVSSGSNLPRRSGLRTATIGTWILGFGFLVFLIGVLLASQSSARASSVAIAGMLIYFLGGALRANYA